MNIPDARKGSGDVTDKAVLRAVFGEISTGATFVYIILAIVVPAAGYASEDDSAGDAMDSAAAASISATVASGSTFRSIKPFLVFVHFASI